MPPLWSWTLPVYPLAVPANSSPPFTTIVPEPEPYMANSHGLSPPLWPTVMVAVAVRKSYTVIRAVPWTVSVPGPSMLAGAPPTTSNRILDPAAVPLKTVFAATVVLPARFSRPPSRFTVPPWRVSGLSSSARPSALSVAVLPVGTCTISLALVPSACKPCTSSVPVFSVTDPEKLSATPAAFSVLPLTISTPLPLNVLSSSTVPLPPTVSAGLPPLPLLLVSVEAS